MQKNKRIKKTIDPSPKVQQLAKQKELGELRQVYPVTRINTIPFITGCMCIFIGIFLLVMTIPMGQYTAYLLAGTTPGLLLCIIGFYLTFSRKIYAHWNLYLWEYGFIYEKKQLIQVFRWNMIANVQRILDPPSSNTYVYKIRHKDGYEVKLGNTFLNITELINTLLVESARHLTHQEFKINTSHNSSIFSSFTLDQQGISNTQETLYWEEIQEFLTIDGVITLHKKGE